MVSGDERDPTKNKWRKINKWGFDGEVVAEITGWGYDSPRLNQHLVLTVIVPKNRFTAWFP